MTTGLNAPLILTAMLDPASQARFERERQRYFPPSRNLVPAHVTLFHHLPGDQRAEVDRALLAACVAQPPAPFAATGLRFLGAGTAYILEMPDIARFRNRLATAWKAWLTAQDAQRWQPHLTIQNKQPAAEAKRVHAELLAGFTRQDGLVTGVVMWEYHGGPWEILGRHPFRGSNA